MSTGHLSDAFCSSVLECLISFEDKETIEIGSEKFRAHYENENVLKADLLLPAFKAVLANSQQSSDGLEMLLNVSFREFNISVYDINLQNFYP